MKALVALFFPRATEGKVIFDAPPKHRWASCGSPNAGDWREIEIAKKTKAGRAVLNLYGDRCGLKAPGGRSHRIVDE